jgi:GNAT superfamily N-acetyltransferase
VVVATTRADVLADLQTDTLVTLNERGESRVTHRSARRRPISLWRGFRICEGVKADYDAFARMHYRDGDELGFVDRVFVLRDRVGQAMGVVVYAHSPPELALRNACTAGRFKGDLARLNREMRILRRLVIHPDLRGCGVGHRLVRRTLTRVGTRYVECLATMGAINPVFEKAGMKRIGTCQPPRQRARLLARLAELDAAPSSVDFEVALCRRPAVRELAMQLVQQWYRSTTARGEHRAQRQSPQILARICRGLVGCEPVYYLWRRRGDHQGAGK